MADKTNKKGKDDAGFLSRAQARTSAAPKSSLSPRRPASTEEKKVSFAFRMPEKLKNDLKIIAVTQGVAIQDLMTQIIQKYVDKYKA